uniref:Uncharacterized protein n=1 Tax=Oryza meridionalis TaxID=40149 RepID=A0A0E0D9Q6_9ORYZ
MKATVKGRYEGDKAMAAATLAFTPSAADLRFKASATDAAFARGPSLEGLTLTLEKPGSFLLDLKPHSKVATSFDLSDQSKAPKLIAESTWNYEI